MREHRNENAATGATIPDHVALSHIIDDLRECRPSFGVEALLKYGLTHTSPLVRESAVYAYRDIYGTQCESALRTQLAVEANESVMIALGDALDSF
jgi:hypothetical protein